MGVCIDRKYIGIQNRTQFENKWLTDVLFWKNTGDLASLLYVDFRALGIVNVL